jgi:hypothetical protein
MNNLLTWTDLYFGIKSEIALREFISKNSETLGKIIELSFSFGVDLPDDSKDHLRNLQQQIRKIIDE